VLPGIGIALMPKVVCPFCWPAYFGVLSAAGLTFLMEDHWLLPISAVFLLAALAALGWRARSRRGYGPLGLGAGSAAVILVGKFAMESSASVYLGIAALMAACVWNAWPRRVVDSSCPACLPVPRNRNTRTRGKKS
jgi:mercuric ion transport protein